MQQPTPSKLQEIKLIRNIPNLTIKQPNSTQLISPSASKQVGSPIDLDSPTRRKKALSLKKAADVEQARNELNSYIDILDTKVYKLVQKHQAEFLVAYRNHIKKVRQQMQEIRNKSLSNANSTVSQTQKIEALEKQLTIFREESLKLFEKVNEKEGTIYNLKLKINELETEKAYQQKSLRELMKRNKQLQGLNYLSETRKTSMEPGTTNQKQFFISRPQHDDLQQFKNMHNLDIKLAGTTFTRSRPYTTAINSKGASVRSRNLSIQINPSSKTVNQNQKMQQIQLKIDQILEGQVNEAVIVSLKQKISQILKANQSTGEKSRIGDFGITMMGRQSFAKKEFKKNSKSFIDSKTQSRTSELQQYFFKSIEAVRKQITRRRGLKSMNFYSQYANLGLSQFKKVDFFRLLELLLSNDKIIAAVHQTIFQQAKKHKM